MGGNSSNYLKPLLSSITIEKAFNRYNLFFPKEQLPPLSLQFTHLKKSTIAFVHNLIHSSRQVQNLSLTFSAKPPAMDKMN